MTSVRLFLIMMAAWCPLAVRAEPAPGAAPVPITLAAALAAGDAANIDVVTARNAVKTAAAGLRIAGTAPNPTVSLGAVSLRPNRIGSDRIENLSDSSLRIDQPFERGGKRQARVAAARAGLEAAGNDVVDTRRQVHAAITTAYFDLMAAERRLQLVTATAESWATGLTIANRRLVAGAIAGGDLARQKVEALRAASAVTQAETDRREAQLLLATLIGRDSEALATIGDWPAAQAAGLESADAVAERRPDVQAAAARVVAARRQLDGAHALRHPDVTAGVQYEHDPNGIGSSVGVGLSFPLPLRNNYGGDIDAAGAALAQAEASAAKVRAVAVAEIITARRAASAASARRASFDGDLLPAARHAADTAEFAYRSGALALLDLLDARRTLQAIGLEAIDAHDDEARALARMRAAETTGDE